MLLTLATAWRLIRPYWVSEDRWPARAMLTFIVALDLLIVYRATRISFWQKDFYDALAAHQAEAFSRLLLELLVIATAGIAMDTARIWTGQALEMRWRHWMTTATLARWLGGNAFYRMEQAARTDNPDQRIAEDLRLLASDSLRLLLGLLSTAVSLASFSVIAWGLAATLSFTLAGQAWDIPRFLLWAAVFYAVAGSLVMEKIGRPLVTVDYQQQQCEADFRYLLVRVRENAEQIAFYRGQSAEQVRLADTFAALRANWRGVMGYTKRLTIASSTYTEFGAYVPYLINGPRFFAGLMTLGDLMQATQAFMRVRVGLSWFIYKYKDIALLRSVVQRLSEFEAALGSTATVPCAPRAIRIDIHTDGCTALQTRHLQLHRPDGRPLCPPLAWHIASGDRWLVQGPSGTGKSTLLRALAGLWPHGSGQILWPADARSLFIPQQSYLPTGTLRECLCYPSTGHAFSTPACTQALEDSRLAPLAVRLDEHGDWAHNLSPGEQQRLAFARVLLHRPSHVFLDEATSALGVEDETLLYQAVTAQLPGITLISVGHRESLRAFHSQVLELKSF